MYRWPLALVLAGAAFVAWSASSAPISYSDLLARPRPAATLTRHYGPAPNQIAELFLPKRKGPIRTIVLIHGGCWLAAIPGTVLMDYLAADLRNRGFAVWNIDYRRIGEDGGGYPGTFLDIAKAMDTLRNIAPAYKLDLSRLVVVGHSAGGQLAAWAAARPHLPRDSVLYEPDPLPVSAVVSLAGINDLADYRDHGPSACGGPSTIDALLGPPSTAHKDVYADTSPQRLLPLGVRASSRLGFARSHCAAAFRRELWCHGEGVGRQDRDPHDKRRGAFRTDRSRIGCVEADREGH